MPSLNRASVLIADNRKSGRYRLLLEARAGEAEAGGTSVTLHDVSQNGLLFEAESAIERDAEIMLDIPGLGSVAARTIWTNGRFYGAEFVKPLSRDSLKAALSASKIVWWEFAPTPSLAAEQIRAQRTPRAAEVDQQEGDVPVAIVDAVLDRDAKAWPVSTSKIWTGSCRCRCGSASLSA